ncbi:uncharacterized protein LOC123565654 [Mercenaria mercenaria]|uniref:uncharacterized protein LOC123565654 n=1 Tax=Mercenaria mercenaria TaxID=6596 RepID=UPI00234F8284|nr:uncharacterized protein LOC123565654 [Mercenaria mercenaria]
MAALIKCDRGSRIRNIEQFARLNRIGAAEDTVQSLGGVVKKNSSIIVSLEETGGPNNVDRLWLFDCLSNFNVLYMGLYLNVNFFEDVSKESVTSDKDLDNGEDEGYVRHSGD